ncbi:hypothetical protein G6F35_018720 [Rhizopus arrhizus]|nr:hypothetical protein G6F35_018720 [Rhizopus arrhizus]
MALWMESDRMGHLVGAIDQAALDEQRLGPDQQGAVPGRPPVPPRCDRFDERSQRGLAGRREDLVPHLVRPEQCSAGAGR